MLKRFDKVLHQLWPLIVFAGMMQIVATSVIARDGFFAQIYHLVWPEFVRNVFDNAVGILWGGFGMALAGALVAEFGLVAIMTAVLSAVLVQIDITQPLTWPRMGADSLLAAGVIGLVVSLLYHWWLPKWLEMLGSGLILTISGAIGSVMYHFGGAWTGNLSWFALPVVTVSRWFGLSDFQLVRDDLSTMSDAMANLQHVLAGNSIDTVPNRFSLYTLYAPFGMMGGIGMALALVLAYWWVKRRLPLPELLGALVNQPALIWLRLPIFWDWRMLVPMILAPLASMGIAAGVLALHWMPPVVYTVPVTTPAPLFAFLGTNGNWVSLLVSGVCLIVSTLIYLPFVKRRLADA